MKILDKVYMDNGATSYPKAPNVAKVMSDYILYNGANVSRGAYKDSMDASRIVYETRELLCDLFNFDHPDHVVFTKNITESINQAIKGLLTEKDHVIISSMEHNAVMRPLHSVGCQVTRLEADAKGYINPEDVTAAIRKETKAIIMLHSSNVCGSINDINAIGKIANDKDLIFILDAAQTAGVIEIDMKKSYIDVLCFTGHKSLLGPSGIGGFLLDPRLVCQMDALIEGGTGSASEQEYQPEHMPDKYESGTPNIVGIYGLNTSLKYLKNEGIEKIHHKEMLLVDYFLNNFKVDDVEIIGAKDTKNRTAVISLDFKSKDNAVIAFQLERQYNIASRVGMHCAPAAHKSLNTFPNGTVRVSFSYFNTIEEVEYLINAIEALT